MQSTENRVKLLINEYGAELRSKASSRLMRTFGWLLRLVGNQRFMEGYWTTLGSTIYYPTRVTDPHQRQHLRIIEHELKHVEQSRKYKLFYEISYLLLPIPVGLAWFRFRWEREAYMLHIALLDDPTSEIERVVANLWNDYAWTWPKSWMRSWFWQEWRRLRDEQNE